MKRLMLHLIASLLHRFIASVAQLWMLIPSDYMSNSIAYPVDWLPEGI
jgi:hypothetical protein